MNIVDKLTRGTDSATGRPIIATLAAPGKTVGASSITLSGSTNWSTTTPVYIAIYTVTAAGIKDPTSQTDWKATLSGTTLSNMTPTGGVDRTYAAGAYVEITFTSAWAKDLYDALSVSMNPDGSLKTAPVRAALGLTTAASGGWDILNAGSAPTVSSGYNHGNKEYALTFSGVDLTAVLSAGMRLKFDRSTPAPTQCMAFTAASSQYASKTSPTGISFTSAMTTEAWVYLNSYAASAIISKTSNGQDGFGLILTASGQLQLNTGTSAGNFKNRVSYQSIPLKRWVHVAGVITQSSGAAALYINGTSVPFSSTDTGTSTSITQAGNLYIGRYADSAGGFFDGYISEARIWSTAQTATQIQDNMAVSLTGSETNLVGLWQGNGAFTDKTANGNTLTPAGGAIATQTANPYNTTEYALVSSVSYASSNTTVIVYTGSNNNIPLATLINPFSSYQETPLGWPGIRWRWQVRRTGLFSAASATVTASPGLSLALTIPAGRSIRAIVRSDAMYNSGSTSGNIACGIYDTSVSGTGVGFCYAPAGTGTGSPLNLITDDITASGSKTYVVGQSSSASTVNCTMDTTTFTIEVV